MRPALWLPVALAVLVALPRGAKPSAQEKIPLRRKSSPLAGVSSPGRRVWPHAAGRRERRAPQEARERVAWIVPVRVGYCRFQSQRATPLAVKNYFPLHEVDGDTLKYGEAGGDFGLRDKTPPPTPLRNGEGSGEGFSPRSQLQPLCRVGSSGMMRWSEWRLQSRRDPFTAPHRVPAPLRRPSQPRAATNGLHIGALKGWQMSNSARQSLSKPPA